MTTHLSRTESLSLIEADLRKNGGKVHGFRSGGGLRVLRIDRAKGKSYYAEAPQFDEALIHLAEDIEAGGRTYKQAYGGIYPHYWTGDSKPSSEVDGKFLLQGRAVDVTFEDGKFVATSIVLEHVKAPEGYEERAQAGETLRWKSRGFEYEIRGSSFPNGEKCTTTSVVSGRKKNGADPWFVNQLYSAEADTIEQALGSLPGATPVILSEEVE